MAQWITDLWNNNKLLFLVLLPIIILVIFKDFIFSYLVNSANKEVEETKKKDQELKQQADQANLQADKLKADSDKLEEEIKDIEGDEDWHKKRE